MQTARQRPVPSSHASHTYIITKSRVGIKTKWYGGRRVGSSRSRKGSSQEGSGRKEGKMQEREWNGGVQGQGSRCWGAGVFASRWGRHGKPGVLTGRVAEGGKWVVAGGVHGRWGCRRRHSQVVEVAAVRKGTHGKWQWCCGKRATCVQV